jgi:hypothetical protein
MLSYRYYAREYHKLHPDISKIPAEFQTVFVRVVDNEAGKSL